MLRDSILAAQNGDHSALLYLIQKFQPLLKRYTLKLDYEDAENDMLLEFIELIYNISLDTLRSTSDGTIVRYIAKAIQNTYYSKIGKRKLQNQDILSWEVLFESQKTQGGSSYIDIDRWMFVDFLKSCPCITNKEMWVLYKVYYEGYTSSDLATMPGSTKQNINQIKNRGLAKLRKWLDT